MPNPTPQKHVAAKPPVPLVNVVKQEPPEEESLKSEEFSFPILQQEPVDAWSLSLQRQQQSIIEDTQKIIENKNVN